MHTPYADNINLTPAPTGNPYGAVRRLRSYLLLWIAQFALVLGDRVHGMTGW